MRYYHDTLNFIERVTEFCYAKMVNLIGRYGREINIYHRHNFHWREKANNTVRKDCNASSMCTFCSNFGNFCLKRWNHLLSSAISQARSSPTNLMILQKMKLKLNISLITVRVLRLYNKSVNLQAGTRLYQVKWMHSSKCVAIKPCNLSKRCNKPVHLNIHAQTI